MSSEGSKLDSAAAQLTSKADEYLHATGSDDDAANKDGSSREGMRNIAKIVKQNAGKGVTNSREYLSNVFGQVSAYASTTSSTASETYAAAKQRGLSSADALKEVAAHKYTDAKGHVSNVHTNINKAIAQGQSQGSASGTRERDLAAEPDELSFPYSWVAWCATCCGKSTGSISATSKGISEDSLEGAAAVLTKSLEDQTRTVQSGGSKAKEVVSEKAEDVKEHVGEKVEYAKSSVSSE